MAAIKAVAIFFNPSSMLGPGRSWPDLRCYWERLHFDRILARGWRYLSNPIRQFLGIGRKPDRYNRLRFAACRRVAQPLPGGDGCAPGVVEGPLKAGGLYSARAGSPDAQTYEQEEPESP